MHILLKHKGRSGRLHYLLVNAVLFITVVVFALALEDFFPGVWGGDSLDELPPYLTRDIFLYSLLAYYAVVVAPLHALSSIRRLHDLNWPGYFALTKVVPIVGLLLEMPLLLVPGTKDQNKYGAVPDWF